LLQRPLVSAASGVDVGQQTLCHYIVAVVLAADLGMTLFICFFNLLKVETIAERHLK